MNWADAHLCSAEHTSNKFQLKKLWKINIFINSLFSIITLTALYAGVGDKFEKGLSRSIFGRCSWPNFPHWGDSHGVDTNFWDAPAPPLLHMNWAEDHLCSTEHIISNKFHLKEQLFQDASPVLQKLPFLDNYPYSIIYGVGDTFEKGLSRSIFGRSSRSNFPLWSLSLIR